MGKRRMMTLDIIDTDTFLEMPMSTQCLYMHLIMRADDDGFIDKPKRIMRMIGSNEDDMKLLITKKYVIPFDSGVVCIKHWRLHNYIRNDRYQPTLYRMEKAQLELSATKEYEVADSLDTIGIPVVDGMDTQVKLSQVKTSKVNKRKGTDVDGLFSSFTKDERLKESLQAFYDMRKGIKKPMTTKAVELLLKRLKDIAANEAEMIELLETAILNSWQNVYPKKDERGVKNEKPRDHARPQFGIDLSNSDD